MSRTALVLEDDPTLARLISAALAGDDWSVEPVTAAASVPLILASTAPQLVVIDFGIQGGAAQLRRLRAEPILRGVPVLAVIGPDAPDLIRQALDCGAADFVCVPFTAHELLARVHALRTPGPREELRILLDRQTAAAVRNGKVFSLVLADLDDAESIVAMFGPAVLDDVLQALAKRLRRLAGVNDVMVRYDSHTLAFVLPGVGHDAAVARAEDLRAALAAAPLDTPTEAVPATACFGVATHEVAEHSGALLLRAEDALCEAMTAGCDTVRAAEPVA
jgi:diguanylate cyclase (GGDEF)-like protein